jgi:hypothetical protein
MLLKTFGGKFSILKFFPKNNKQNVKVFETTKLNKKINA